MTKHPEFAWQYLTRVRSIKNLMNVGPTAVKSYLQEYYKVNIDIEIKLRSYPFLGQMDRRKNEVLYALVRLAKPICMVETGVAAGVSSTLILRAMSINGRGKLYSIDPNLRSFDGITLPPNKPIGFMVPESLRERWQLVIGFSWDVLEPLLQKLGRVDLFFHDSEHNYKTMIFEYDITWRYLATDGLIVSDNIEFNNAFDDFVKSKNALYKKFYSFGVIRKS